MRNFQGIVFIGMQIYREIFNSALVYLKPFLGCWIKTFDRVAILVLLSLVMSAKGTRIFQKTEDLFRAILK